jgi:pyruvate/2-oxoglutarate dehydrogenase complex dihydrolipoamide dehydrogenase (E3) component
VQQWREGAVRSLRAAGERLRVLEGMARFVGAREVEIGGKRHRAETIIINSGTRAAVPAIPGLETVPWLDNHRAMNLRELPRHLIVLGGGYIGCELGQMFRRFGSAVTIVDRKRQLLAREDADIAAALEGVFRDEGIGLRQGATVEQVARDGDGVIVRCDGEELRGSHLLIAVGRRANSDDLGCDAAGIALDAHGFVIVDDRYRTSVPGVFAVGDVAGGPQLTHSSWDDHRRLFELLLGRGTRGRADRIVPSTVFTDPPVAQVGLREAEARARGVDVEVATMPFSQIGRALETGESAGLLKVLVDPADGRLLGATIVGADAGELIHIFVPLIRAGATAQSIVDAEFVHPTFAEGVQTLVMSLGRYALDFQ